MLLERKSTKEKWGNLNQKLGSEKALHSRSQIVSIRLTPERQRPPSKEKGRPHTNLEIIVQSIPVKKQRAGQQEVAVLLTPTVLNRVLGVGVARGDGENYDLFKDGELPLPKSRGGERATSPRANELRK